MLDPFFPRPATASVPVSPKFIEMEVDTNHFWAKSLAEIRRVLNDILLVPESPYENTAAFDFQLHTLGEELPWRAALRVVVARADTGDVEHVTFVFNNEDCGSMAMSLRFSFPFENGIICRAFTSDSVISRTKLRDITQFLSTFLAIGKNANGFTGYERFPNLETFDLPGNLVKDFVDYFGTYIDIDREPKNISKLVCDIKNFGQVLVDLNFVQYETKDRSLVGSRCVPGFMLTMHVPHTASSAKVFLPLQFETERIRVVAGGLVNAEVIVAVLRACLKV